jgi:hypothetical protein
MRQERQAAKRAKKIRGEFDFRIAGVSPVSFVKKDAY